jgi:hypothetical protein
VAAHFSIQGTFASARPYGSGHIHDTFLVETKEKDSPDYILQRINHDIFKDVPRLMENIVRVTGHIRGKLNAMPGSDPGREVLTVIPTIDEQNFYHDRAAICSSTAIARSTWWTAPSGRQPAGDISGAF